MVAKPAPTPAKPVAPQEPKEKKSLFQKIKQELKRDEALAAGPWTNPDTWKNVRKSMTSFRVRQVLGNPSKIKNSVNPRIQRIYRYEGDLDGDGVVGDADLLAIIGNWGTPNADITGDNMTDVSDLLVAIGAYGSCP